MGNDGGSIPDRRDLVRTKAKVSSLSNGCCLSSDRLGHIGGTGRQSEPDESSLVLLCFIEGMSAV